VVVWGLLQHTAPLLLGGDNNPRIVMTIADIAGKWEVKASRTLKQGYWVVVIRSVRTGRTTTIFPAKNAGTPTLEHEVFEGKNEVLYYTEPRESFLLKASTEEEE
jgi:hypothetical protein